MAESTLYSAAPGQLVPRDAVVAPPTLYAYGVVLYRRSWIVALTAASALAAAVFFSMLLPDVYEASAEFYVVSDSAALGNTGARAAAMAPLTTQEVERWHLGILESGAVQRLVAKTVGGTSGEDLERAVDVEYARKHIARVRARDGDPARAAAIANAYPQALTAFLMESGGARGKRSLEAIGAALNGIESQLIATYGKLRLLLGERQSPSVSAELNNLVERRGLLEREIATSSAQLNGIEQRLNVTHAQLEAEAKRSAGPQGTLFTSTVLRLRSEINDLETELAGINAEFDGRQGERYPKARVLTAKLGQARKSLDRELASISGAEVREPNSPYELLRRDLAGLYKEQSALKAEVAAKTAELESIAGRAGRLQNPALREQELRVEISRLERGRDALRAKQQDLLVQSASEASPVVVVQAAEPATQPKFPSIPFNALVAAALGIFCGIYIAFAYDYAARPRTDGAVA